MRLSRVLRHLLTGPLALRRSFPPASLAAIESAIRESEQGHGGQIRFAVEPALELLPLLRGQTARERALQVFAELGVWDTAQNNGVLVYLLLADRDIEIVADRGIHAQVGPQGWEAVCRQIEAELRAGRFEAGVLAGIRAVGAEIARHFPAGAGANEQPDRPVLL